MHAIVVLKGDCLVGEHSSSAKRSVLSVFSGHRETHGNKTLGPKSCFTEIENISKVYTEPLSETADCEVLLE